MIVVLDTNVLVSALLSPFQAPARVLDLVLSGEIDAVVDDRILAEYRAVLARPKFGFDVRAVHDLLDYFEHAGVVAPAMPLTIDPPHPDDCTFVEAAARATTRLVRASGRPTPLHALAAPGGCRERGSRGGGWGGPAAREKNQGPKWAISSARIDSTLGTSSRRRSTFSRTI